MNSNKIKDVIEKALKDNDINLVPGDKLSSLEIVTLAVAIEKAFKLKFDIDEISYENFKSIKSIQDLVSQKINSPSNNT